LRWWLFRQHDTPAVARCYEQAMGLTLLGELLLLGYQVLFVGLTALIYVPLSDRYLHVVNMLLPGLAVGLVAVWFAVWIAAVVLAAAGSSRRLAVVWRLGRTRRRRRVAAGIASVGALLFGVVVGTTLYSTTLARERDERPARVYVLYDRHAVNLGPTPRWLMTLGS